MVKISLECAIVGHAGTFDVTIDDGEKVGDLKDVIKEKNEEMKGPTRNLRLFLAKMADGAWLDGAGAAAVALDERGHPQGCVWMDPILWIKNPNYFGDNFQPGEGQVHVLVVVLEGVSAPVNKRKRKRVENEDAPDAWIKAIKDEQVTKLPSTCEDLRKHLQRPLNVKVPVNKRLSQIMSTKNTTGELTSILDKVFEPYPREIRSDITAGILGGVIDPLGSGSEFATKDTYHHLWDSLIAMLLRRVSNGKFHRNKNTSASTGPYRPDLCFYYKNSNVCVMRGEEKARGELQVPVKELHEKLTWRYDAAPYVFGYAAVGLQVCLVAIRKDEMTERGAKVEIIETYDLGDLHGRLSFFLALLNLSTLFRPVVDLIQPLDILEYGTIERDNGVQITFAEDCVVKTYPKNML
ncbi:Serine/threonine protein kinase, partial [Phytophthora palmivora]